MLVKHQRSKGTPETLAKYRAMREAGLTSAAIEKELDICHATANNWRSLLNIPERPRGGKPAQGKRIHNLKCTKCHAKVVPVAGTANLWECGCTEGSR